jgi:hypothetical protein
MVYCGRAKVLSSQIVLSASGLYQLVLGRDLGGTPRAGTDAG